MVGLPSTKYPSRSRTGFHGLLATLLFMGCGLRTDPTGEQICVEEGEDGTGEPSQDLRAGSCEAPIKLAAVPVQINGNLGGCGDIVGSCGGSGGEDVYKLPSATGAYDAVFTFNPQGTDINPVFRVVRIPVGSPASPCDEDLSVVAAPQESVCAPIVTQDPTYGTFVLPSYDYYAIVDSHAGESGPYRMSFNFGVAEVNDLCLSSVAGDTVDNRMVVQRAADQPLVITGELEATQGHFEGTCFAPGDERMFPLQVQGPGKLEVEILRWSGTSLPVLSLTLGCSGHHEIACHTGSESERYLQHGFMGPSNFYLVMDQAGSGGGNFEIQVSFN